MYKLKNLPFIIAVKRKEKSLSQKQVAELLGVSAQAVSKWETGLSYPDITILPELANVLGVSIDTLFGDGDEVKSMNLTDFNFPDEFKGLMLLDAINDLACYADRSAEKKENGKLFFYDGSEVDLNNALIMSKGNVLIRLVRASEMLSYIENRLDDESVNSTSASEVFNNSNNSHSEGGTRLEDSDSHSEKNSEPRVEKENVAEEFVDWVNEEELKEDKNIKFSVDDIVSKVSSFAKDVSDYSVKAYNEIKKEIDEDDVRRIKEASKSIGKSAINIGSSLWKETSEAFKEARSIFEESKNDMAFKRRDFVAQNVSESISGKIENKSDFDSLIFNINCPIDVELRASEDDTVHWNFRNKSEVAPHIEVEDNDNTVKFNITRPDKLPKKEFNFRAGLFSLNICTSKYSGTLEIYVPNKQFKNCDIQISGSSDFDSKIPVGRLIAKVSGSGEVYFPAAYDLEARISGSGEVRVDEASNANLYITGSGECKVKNLNGGNVDASIMGSGDVCIDRGFAEKLEVRVAGSGDFEGDKLTAKRAEFYVSGSGDIEVDRVIEDVIEKGTKSDQIIIRNRGL